MASTIACTRCGTGNEASASFCAGCKFPLQFHRPAILNDNRWEAAPDELAVFFRINHLQGLFSKELVIPAGMRGLIIQDNRTEEVGHGTYAVDTMLARLNRFFRDKQADILITRQNPVAVDFSFEDVQTAEFLKLGVTASLNLKVGDVAVFAQNFMSTPGCVTVSQLRALLGPAVRQAMVDYCAGRSLREMAGKSELRSQLTRVLQGSLKERVASLGLLLLDVEAVTLRHEKFMANRQLEGTLWLAADEQKVRLAHQRDLDALYGEDEWRKVKRDEEDLRLRYRRQELGAEEAEQAHVIRLREIALLERVREAATREQAIELGAADAIADLDAEHEKSAGERQSETERWKHVQALARMRQDTEFKLESARIQSTLNVESLRLENEIEKVRIANEIEQIRQISDEEARREREARLRLNEAAVHRREQELSDMHHQSGVIDLKIAVTARQNEAARVKDYEDKLAEARIRDLDRSGESKDADAKFDRLRKVMELDQDGSRYEFEQKERERDAEWRRELERREREDKERTQAAQLEIERAKVIAQLPISAQISIAKEGANASALADLAKIEAFKGMNAEQIMAVSLQHSSNAAEVLRAKYAQPTNDQEVAKAQAQLLEQQNAMQMAMMREQMSFSANALKEIKEAAIGVAHAGARPAAPTVVIPGVPGGASYGAPQYRVKVCIHCQSDNDEVARFCKRCGKPLE